MVNRLSNKAEELHKQNQELKKRNDAKEKGFKAVANDDLIMI